MDLEAREGRRLKLPPGLLSVLPRDLAMYAPIGLSCETARRAALDRQLRRWEGNPFTPFAYQQAVIDGLSRRSSEGCLAGMLVLPTGGGKTSVGIAVALERLRSQDRGLVVWIAPQRELLQQAMQACERVWWSGRGPHSLDLRILQSSREPGPTAGHSMVFGTPVTVDRWLERIDAGSRVTQVIFDEAHHLGAEVYSHVWLRLREGSRSMELALGLSATPMRRESSTFDAMTSALDGQLFYPQCLLPNPIRALRKLGVLSALRVKHIDSIPGYARQLGEGLGAGSSVLSADPDYWMGCINATLSATGRTIVYCPSRALGELFARHLCSLGERAEFMDGDDEIEARTSVLERFRDGQTRVVVNVGLLLEGVDCPAAESAVITFPVQSPIKLLQIAGRLSRGPAVGGTSEATLHCSDMAVAKFFGELSAEPDYSALWPNGTAL
jgi:ATP-dependent helicase IRC3